MQRIGRIEMAVVSVYDENKIREKYKVSSIAE